MLRVRNPSGAIWVAPTSLVNGLRAMGWTVLGPSPHRVLGLVLESSLESEVVPQPEEEPKPEPRVRRSRRSKAKPDAAEEASE